MIGGLGKIFANARDALLFAERQREVRDELKKLSTNISALLARFEKFENEKKLEDAVRDERWNGFIENASLATKNAVLEASSRFEGDIKAKLVELDLRLQAVERGSGKRSSPKKLPKP